MSWVGRLWTRTEGARNAMREVVVTLAETLDLADEMAGAASAPPTRTPSGWRCKKCRHINRVRDAHCGGCGRKKGSPLP